VAGRSWHRHRYGVAGRHYQKPTGVRAWLWLSQVRRVWRVPLCLASAEVLRVPAIEGLPLLWVGSPAGRGAPAIVGQQGPAGEGVPLHFLEGRGLCVAVGCEQC
jgi:hypothetical protein